MKVTVKFQSSQTEVADLPEDLTVRSFRQHLADTNLVPFHSSRVQVFEEKTKLREEAQLKDGGVYTIEDFGLSLPFRYGVSVEYVGAPIFYVAVFLLLNSEGDQNSNHEFIRKVALICWICHFTKRVLECQFVHRFSAPAMPFQNIIRNSAYYWLFGCGISYAINHPKYELSEYDFRFCLLGGFIFVFCEFGNLSIHLAQRAMRTPGVTKRVIPYPDNDNPFTNLYAFVSCPNYTYEVGSWIGFSLMTHSLTVAFFAFAGCAIMSDWALKTHKNYLKQFDDYPKNRKAIIPLIL